MKDESSKSILWHHKIQNLKDEHKKVCTLIIWGNFFQNQISKMFTHQFFNDVSVLIIGSPIQKIDEIQTQNKFDYPIIVMVIDDVYRRIRNSVMKKISKF